MATSSNPAFLSMADVPAAVKRLTGESCSRASADRWRRNGTNGIRLRTIYVGGRHLTTDDWLLDYFAAVGAAKSGGQR